MDFSGTYKVTVTRLSVSNDNSKPKSAVKNTNTSGGKKQGYWKSVRDKKKNKKANSSEEAFEKFW